MVELHRVRRSSLGCRAEISRVPEHGRQGYECSDDLSARAHLHPLDMPTPSIQIPNDLTHELIWSRDLDLHDRFENHIATSTHALFERERPRNLERHLRRVNLVVRPIDESGFQVDDRESCLAPRRQGLADTGIDRGDVLPGDGATNDLVFELV